MTADSMIFCENVLFSIKKEISLNTLSVSVDPLFTLFLSYIYIYIYICIYIQRERNREGKEKKALTSQGNEKCESKKGCSDVNGTVMGRDTSSR